MLLCWCTTILRGEVATSEADIRADSAGYPKELGFCNQDARSRHCPSPFLNDLSVRALYSFQTEHFPKLLHYRACDFSSSGR